MAQIAANDVKHIKDWIDNQPELFLCDCEPYQESDTGAWIHNEDKCSAFMEDHFDITMSRLIEWLEKHGPIEVRGW